jgi:hypothetical protein
MNAPSTHVAFRRNPRIAGAASPVASSTKSAKRTGTNESGVCAEDSSAETGLGGSLAALRRRAGGGGTEIDDTRGRRLLGGGGRAGFTEKTSLRDALNFSRDLTAV